MNIKRIAAGLTAVQIAFSGVNVLAEEAMFEDIEKTSEVYGAVKLLKNLGIIEGVGDNRFAPENTVTRADFAVMIDKAISLENIGDNKFSDVPEDSYFAKSVQKAAEAGIIKGDENGNFNPYKPINKQEAAVILTKAYEYVGKKAIFAPNAAEDFSDYEEIAAWARGYIDKAFMTDLISAESESKIGAEQAFKRADTALSISKLILNSGDKKIPDTGKENQVVQWNRGNIFSGSETMGFTFETGNDVIEYVVTDYYNKIVERKTVKAENGTIDLSFPGYSQGYYEVGIYGADNDGVKHELFRTSMCLLEEYDFRSVDREDSAFGMNMHCDRGSSGWKYDLLDEAELIGVKHVRDGYEWPGIEGSAGNYTRLKNVLTNYYNLLKEHNMSVIMTTGFNHPLYDNGATPYTDAGRTAFAGYSKSFYDLYGTDQAQDMFNEFWGPQFGDRGDGPADGLPEYYAPLLEKVYTTIKAEYPESILNFCVGHGDWQEKLFALGALNYCDVINIHRYGPNRDSDVSLETDIRGFLEHLRNNINEYAPDKINMPIWVTETGANSSTNQYGHSEESVARSLPRIYALYRGNGATRIYFYDFLDDGNTDSEHEDRFGLLRAFGSTYGNYTPKPGYVSVGAAARVLTGEEFVENKSLESGMEWNKFRVNGKDINMIYTRGLQDSEQFMDVAVYADGDVNITDIMGVKETYTPTDGKIYLTLTGDPLYIEGNISDVREEKIVDLKADDWVPTGKEYGITANSLSGETDGMTFVLDGGRYSAGEAMQAQEFYVPETRKVIVGAEKNGALCGRLALDVTAQKNYETSIDVGVDKKEGSDGFEAIAKIKLKNNAPYEVTVSSVLINMDGETTEKSVNEKLAPEETKDMSFNVGDAILGTSHEANARMCIDGVLSDEVDAEGKFQYNAINRKTINVDGVLDDRLDEVMGLSVEKNGEVFRLSSDGSKYGGASDCSGNIWITYDDENLYVTADITDDEHSAPSVGEQIWRNDSIQIDFYQHETPGYNIVNGFAEIGVSLLPDGTTALWTWKKVADIGEKDKPNGVKAVVSRNGNHTIYEAALNWKETGGIDINNISRIDISICINDCDNGVRKSGIEVGGGIVYGKDPSKYNKYSLIR